MSSKSHHEAEKHEVEAQSDDPVVTPFLLSLSERQAILDKAVKAITRGGPMIAQWKKLVVQVQQVRNEQT